MWLAARLIVIGVNVIGIMSIPTERSNLDWPSCFLISAVVAVALFGWLTVVRDRVNANWAERYAWRQPFFPVNRFPFQFWFLSSYALIWAGAAALVRDFALHRGHKAVSGTFFFMGLFILLALRIWASKFGRRTLQR